MGWTGLIILLFIILLGGYYIRTVTHLSKLDGEARGLAGELDTLIWDRNHVYEQIISILEEKEIPLDEKLTKKISLGLGMPVTMQMAHYTDLHNRWKSVEAILKEHPELENDEKLQGLIKRFESTRIDIIGTSKKYNRAATTFNAYIEKPFPGFMAARKTKGQRSHFSVELAEVVKNEGTDR